ncbi:Fe-S protein assembly co-chaperone HscB [Eionea flava]
MNFTQNYFDLFNLPINFTVDNNRLAAAYRDLQKQFHPDKVADKPASEQRIAVQFAGFINTAYETLRSPVSRAIYMLAEKGFSIDEQAATVSDGQFLFLQMEWRESLSSIISLIDKDEAEEQLEQLEQQVNQSFSDFQQIFDKQYSDEAFEAAKATIAKMQFVAKMLAEIDGAESTIFDD